MMGGVTNALSGRLVFNAIMAAIGNVSTQVNDPCFNGDIGDIKYSQAIAAALLGAADLGSLLPPNLLSHTSMAIHAASAQTVNNTINVL